MINWDKILERAKRRWITINIQNKDYSQKQIRLNKNIQIQNFIINRINKLSK